MRLYSLFTVVLVSACVVALSEVDQVLEAPASTNPLYEVTQELKPMLEAAFAKAGRYPVNLPGMPKLKGARYEVVGEGQGYRLSHPAAPKAMVYDSAKGFVRSGQ